MVEWSHHVCVSRNDIVFDKNIIPFWKEISKDKIRSADWMKNEENQIPILVNDGESVL